MCVCGETWRRGVVGKRTMVVIDVSIVLDVGVSSKRFWFFVGSRKGFFWGVRKSFGRCGGSRGKLLLLVSFSGDGQAASSERQMGAIGEVSYCFANNMYATWNQFLDQTLLI